MKKWEHACCARRRTRQRLGVRRPSAALETPGTQEKAPEGWRSPKSRGTIIGVGFTGRIFQREGAKAQRRHGAHPPIPLSSIHVWPLRGRAMPGEFECAGKKKWEHDCHARRRTRQRLGVRRPSAALETPGTRRKSARGLAQSKISRRSLRVGKSSRCRARGMTRGVSRSACRCSRTILAARWWMSAVPPWRDGGRGS